MRVVTWQQVVEEISDLSSRILSSGFKPSMLVAVARGGWIPAYLLSRKLNVRRLASIGISYGDQARTQLHAYSLPSPIGPEDRILLVEDRLESGKSLREAAVILKSRGSVVRTACLFLRPDSVITPDYYLLVTADEVLFPWEG